MSHHQVEADIHLPVSSGLLKRILSPDQRRAIHDMIGLQELRRLASVSHAQHPCPDYGVLARQERRDLDVLYLAIKRVTGKERPWIIGYASEFAQGLLACIQETE